MDRTEWNMIEQELKGIEKNRRRTEKNKIE
jgi:hypothetical protein